MSERHDAPSEDTAMRALMVLVADGIISSNRAREIVGMTHEEQRAHWRREHKQAMRDVAAQLEAEIKRLRAALREILSIGERHVDEAIGRRIADFREAIKVAQAAMGGDDEDSA